MNVQTFEQPGLLRSSNDPSQDAVVVTFFPEERSPSPGTAILRLVVIDGITETAATPMVNGGSGAMHAVELLKNQFRKSISLRAGARNANDELYSEYAYLPSPRSRPQACFAGVDISFRDSGSVDLEAVRSVDCELWIEDLDGLRPGFRGYGIEPSRLREYKAFVRDLRDRVSFEELREQGQQLEDQLFGTPDGFGSTPIGRFATCDLKLETFHLLNAQPSLVLATDGLKLSHSRTADEDSDVDLNRWIRTLRNRERHNDTIDGSVKTSDDIALVVLGDRALGDLSDLPRSIQRTMQVRTDERSLVEQVEGGDRSRLASPNLRD